MTRKGGEGRGRGKKGCPGRVRHVLSLLSCISPRGRQGGREEGGERKKEKKKETKQGHDADMSACHRVFPDQSKGPTRRRKKEKEKRLRRNRFFNFAGSRSVGGRGGRRKKAEEFYGSPFTFAEAFPERQKKDGKEEGKKWVFTLQLLSSPREGGATEMRKKKKRRKNAYHGLRLLRLLHFGTPNWGRAGREGRKKKGKGGRRERTGASASNFWVPNVSRLAEKDSETKRGGGRKKKKKKKAS